MTPAKRAANKKYRKKNREKVNKLGRIWYSKNKEKARGYRRKYRLNHREQVNEWARNYYHKIKDRKHGIRLERLYGITLIKYHDLLNEQKGCAICGTDKPYGVSYIGNKKYFAVDHDHRTKNVRGILCHNCNRGLGAFMDSVEILEKAITYLKKFTS